MTGSQPSAPPFPGGPPPGQYGAPPQVSLLAFERQALSRSSQRREKPAYFKRHLQMGTAVIIDSLDLGIPDGHSSGMIGTCGRSCLLGTSI